MQIDRTKVNFMPLIRGPLWDQSNLPRHVYQEIETLIFEYETDPAAIPPLLPDPFKPGKSPTVSVLFNDTNGVDFMAGRGYRMAAISVSAQFDGEDGHMEGSYVLGMPENDTLPIITGREWLGMPKFFTDISPIKIMADGSLRCEASLWGHLLFGIKIAPPLKSQNALIRKAASSQSSNTPSFGYKYISSFKGPPDADYPTVMWNDVELAELALGKEGTLYFGNTTEEEVGHYQSFIDAIRSLEIRKVTQTVHSRGAMVLRNDKNGRLR